MSKDIRSYFTTISRKTTTIVEKDKYKENLSQKTLLNSSDIISSTPEAETSSKKNKKPIEHTRTKRKRIVDLTSDSESENDNTIQKSSKALEKVHIKKSKPNEKLTLAKSKTINTKLISPLEAFGNEPIKQDKHQKNMQPPELSIHDDEDFDKTLLELDEDELLKSVEKVNNSMTLNENPETPIKNQINDYIGEKHESSSKSLKISSRKRKLSENNDEIINDPDLDRYEKKRYSAILYQKYLQRSGPAHLGSKWIPKGKFDCLKGLCFIITGVLDSLERDQAETLIKEHGGRCTHSVSGKVNYMILGEDGGPAKIEKARKLGIKLIAEDDLIDLICVKSGIINQNIKHNKNVDKSEMLSDNKMLKKHYVNDTPIVLVKENNDNNKEDNNSNSNKCLKTQFISNNIVKKELINGDNNIEYNNLAWVDKYKPTDVSQIIGQQGERSNVKKLILWLQDWYKNRARELVGKGIPRPSPWARDDDGAYFRAALLSGPPGVGKTTTAALVCKQLEFDIVEFNASDTRNKRKVHEEVSQILNTTSLAGFFQNGSAPSRKHALLMDEVDGMSGNEDRGGIQELINLIKTTNVPIICMCNDRQHPKIRTLANYCYDLRFTKPRLEQIRGAMMTICFKEGIKIKPDALTHIIQGTGQDVRQTLNQLALLSVGTTSNDTETISQQSKSAQKDVKLGPWEVIRKVFSAEEHKTMTLADKSKLFFHDYSIGPLFVQENYLKLIPHCPKNEQLQRLANASDAISMGDVVDARIRSTQNWSLLELQAMYASVLPGHYLEGHFSGQIDFPGWLGKNSKANKFQRMLSEINAHTRINISGDRTSIGLDYVRSLRDAIAMPMLRHGTEGIPNSINVMRTYNLLREDLTNLVELAHWPKSKDPFDTIDSKVKSAFTRTYNKETPILPYAAPGSGTVKTKRGVTLLNDVDDATYGDEYNDAPADESNDDDDNDINNDTMIKIKKSSSASTRGKGVTTKSKATRIKRGNKK